MRMRKKNSMGQFEQNVLISVFALEPEAFGLAIQRKLTELYLGKDINLGSVYVTLERLEVKKYVRPFEQRASGRGQARRCYRVTPEGQKALKESASQQKRSLAVLAKIWRRLGWVPW